MPELPEVETVARGLRASLVGRTILNVEVRWARSIVGEDVQAFTRRLTGQKVTGIERRGKWLIVSLSGGDALLIHLRMTGRLVIEPDGSAEDRHTRVLFLLDEGERLRFSDMRKFGRLWLVHDPAEALADLGPEPLADNFTAARLGQMLARRRGRIKPLLLNQRFLVGLGNIYVDEALWRAGIHPLRRADTLTMPEVRRLHQAIRCVLQAAIAGGGTTLDNGTFQQADGQPGEFAGQLSAYGRTGEPCPRCGAAIERIKVSQRGTHFCPCCQPRPESESEIPEN